METLIFLAGWAQILSIPIAVIAILVSIWLYYKSKQRKAIACVFDQIESPLEIKAGEALDGAIRISYKGKSVRNIFLVRFKVKNTGNLPIRQTDIISPLTFRFEKDTVVLREPRVIEQKPSNLRIKWGIKKTDEKEVIFLFDLLNPGDEVAAEFLCAGDAKLPNIMARIEGVTNVDTQDPEEKRLRNDLIGALSVPLIFVVTLLLQKYSVSKTIEFPEFIKWIASGLFILGTVGFFLLLIWMQILKPIIKYTQHQLKKKSSK